MRCVLESLPVSFNVILLQFLLWVPTPGLRWPTNIVSLVLRVVELRKDTVLDAYSPRSRNDAF